MNYSLKLPPNVFGGSFSVILFWGARISLKFQTCNKVKYFRKNEKSPRIPLLIVIYCVKIYNINPKGER